MDLVINGLMTASGLVALVGLVTAVKPMWKVRHRWQGAALALAGILIFGGLASVPATRPADVSSREWARRLDICREVNDVRDCPLSATAVTSAQAKLVSRTPKSETDPTTPGGREAVVVSFQTTQDELLRVSGPCDEGLLKVAKVSGRYAAYNAAVRAQRACRQASMAMGDLKFGAPLPSPAQRDMNAALQCFEMAYGQRADAMELGAKIMDANDTRPSKLGEYQASTADAIQRTKECALQYAQAAQKHGLAGAASMGPKPHLPSSS